MRLTPFLQVLPWMIRPLCLAASLSSGRSHYHNVISRTDIVPPSLRGPMGGTPADSIPKPKTDVEKIVSTVQSVDQKDGPTTAELPDKPVGQTTITAVDGHLTDGASKPNNRGGQFILDSGLSRSGRARNDYQLVFSGVESKDAAVEGTAYLTYTLVSNSTYNIQDCLDACSSVPGCVFVNLFRELNNHLLDFTLPDRSNLKCAMYADIHTASEKTYLGGVNPDGSSTYIQESSGFALKELVDPVTPEGYELAFGPIEKATNSAGYMGFVFLDKYDVSACAQVCNQRGADNQGGSCQFFNIWRALDNGIPTTYTCSLYYIPTGESSATNPGQGSISVTLSRGYKRTNLVPDGGFESYTNLTAPAECHLFCYTSSTPTWNGTSSVGSVDDASIFFYRPYAHSGNSSALLGSASGADSLPGTLQPSSLLKTIPGRKYQIAFFQNSAYSGREFQSDAWLEVSWNGKVVDSSKGYNDWKFESVVVDAVGQDVLSFRGGAAPAWTFLDDIAVWLL